MICYSCYSSTLTGEQHHERIILRPIIYGLLGAFFFASTFICNRAMDLAGGNWVWSASLRYIFTVPILALFLMLRPGSLGHAWQHLKSHPKEYLIWSTVGFGVFYALICFAAAYGEGWLVAGSWQIVIVTGSLIAPFFFRTQVSEINGVYTETMVRQKTPWRSLRWSLVMIAGMALMQYEHAQATSFWQAFLVVVPVVIAAFAYPLGNRKMMEVCGEQVNTFERVFNMTLASMPFFLILSLYGLWDSGLPTTYQMTQSFIVALFAGVIGTLFFFAATNLVRYDMHKMASIEATQATEAVFTLLGELIILSAPLPKTTSIIGMLLVAAGMILHSTKSRR